MSAPIRSRLLTGTPVEEHGLLMPVPWIGLSAAGGASDQSITVTAVAEVETAVDIAVVASGTPQSITVNAASEVETAVSVLVDRVFTVTPASETETAGTVSVVTSGNGMWGMIPIGI